MVLATLFLGSALSTAAASADHSPALRDPFVSSVAPTARAVPAVRTGPRIPGPHAANEPPSPVRERSTLRNPFAVGHARAPYAPPVDTIELRDPFSRSSSRRESSAAPATPQLRDPFVATR